MKTSYQISFIIKMLLVLYTLLILLASNGRSDDIKAEDLLKASAPLRDAWQQVKTLKYQMQSRDTLTPELHKITGYKGTDRNLIVADFTIWLQSNAFAWETVRTLPSGNHERSSRGAFSNNTLNMLMRSSEPVFVVGTKPHTIADNPLAEYNLVSDCFAFLMPEKWELGIQPVITLADIVSIERWTAACKNITEIKDEKFQGHTCLKVSFKISPTLADTVFFSKQELYAPICWQHYENGQLMHQISVLESAKISVNPNSILSLPKRLQSTFYDIDGGVRVLINNREQSISHIELNQSIQDDVFSLDPTQADLIFDRDANTYIKVPH